MKWKKFGRWLEVPCIDNFGTCIYENVCDLLSQITNCPSQLVKIGLDCHCPFKVVSIIVILLVIIIAVTYTCISKDGVNIDLKTIYIYIKLALILYRAKFIHTKVWKHLFNISKWKSRHKYLLNL